MMSVTQSNRWVVVGATGVVGTEMLSILADRGVPEQNVTALGSERSVGRTVNFGSHALRVEAASFAEVQPGSIVLLAVGAETARELVPRYLSAGALVVDNSSAFRGDPDVPLCIPEVNGAALSNAKLIANPNCSTILLAVALAPLRAKFGLREIVVSTYQAASGAGLAAMTELEEQTRAVLAGSEAEPRIFPEPCAFNVFPHESDLDVASGWNGEERKMISEMRRVFEDEALQVNPTCVRVPVLRAHSQSVLVTLKRAADEDEVRASLSDGEGLRLLDDRLTASFPTPLRATGQDEVLVGRLRSPGGKHRSTRWNLWLSGDQLRKGAALNAIQCAERWLALNSEAG